MRRIARLKTNCAVWPRAIAVIVLGASLAACANNSSPVSEAAYSTKIVGRWQGTVGDLKETMSIKPAALGRTSPVLIGKIRPVR
jgi:hypothetical protein